MSNFKKSISLNKASKAGSNNNLTFRTIGQIGKSMSSTMISKAKSKDDDNSTSPSSSIVMTSEQLKTAEENLLSDITEVRYVMDLFLNSRIPEAEKILEPKRNSTLYHSLGYSFILFLRSIMTFQQSDIQDAITALKNTIQMADSMRKKETGWFSNMTVWIKGGLHVQDICNMSRLQRHAELVHAECFMLKALLCIVHEESFVAFLREALNVKSSYNVYKALQKYLNHIKQEIIQGKDIESYALDDHFTSGVSLGIGLFNVIISLFPNTILKFVEFVGFSSDRVYGMEQLEMTGGWEQYAGLPPDELPPPQDPNEGLRRQFCDMVLLLYNIILSKLIPLSDVNEELSNRILAYNLKVYPDGVFFLYFSGRQLSSQRQLKEAKAQYQRAIQIQKDWKQLHHICYWELGLIHLTQQDWQEAVKCYSILQKESNWSKAVYYYMQAISLYNFSQLEEASEMMHKVSGAKQKFVGKSIPLEKFVARKARKFISQGNRLLFPDLEILVAFSAFDFMSFDELYKNLKRTNDEINRLTHEERHKEALNYYDDLCLAHYLRAITLRLLLEQKEMSEWKQLFEESVTNVKKNADKLQLDHYIYYFTRYEEGLMMIMDKKYDEAKEIIQSIIKISEKGQYSIGVGSHSKNKYSLENTLIFKCHNCITKIQTMAKKNKSI
ncbi:uncharacterized protein BX663DRAFT_514064 [Cokeromyces recurvatus]|uniref:uncharacterized protein n=1 Tax=Cokeromyces recurvatus TaxID=90255 RepID=UPI00221E9EB4|nr:uncharacterized protein BX663DRAFT_514064 [Cokeromyces recurvatus]KAI7901307.1 hypothetical protein BX663DRAFT_514064 [Cokeromyces recurvatus]